MSTDQDICRRLEQAVAMANAAGEVTLRYFQTRGFRVERKADRSPVTVADREAETLLRTEISRAFPTDAILGEEFGEQPGTSGFRWILDPIDGTKSFIFGVPLYGTLIGVEHAGRSVAGVIHVPALSETVYAAVGHGCWYRRGAGEPVRTRVSATERLEEGLFVTSQVDGFVKRQALDAYLELERQAYVTRTWGDAYGYLLVATGRAEVMIDPLMSVWDAAAIQPVLEEAEGAFTDWQGQPTIYADEAIGSNQRVHAQVVAVTRQFPKPRG